MASYGYNQGYHQMSPGQPGPPGPPGQGFPGQGFPGQPSNMGIPGNAPKYLRQPGGPMVSSHQGIGIGMNPNQPILPQMLAGGGQHMAGPQGHPQHPQGLSLPEEIISTLSDPKLDPPENIELRRLREIVLKDAKQDMNYKLQEMRFARKILNKQIELDYLAQLRATRQTHPNISFGDGYMGYGNGWTGGQVRLIYPKDRKRGRRRAPEPYIEQEQADYMASVPEVLAPVRIDFEMEKYRLRDTFTLNVNEKTISINDLAQNLLEDFYIPANYTQQIAQSIKEQLNDFHPHSYDNDTLKSNNNPDIEEEPEIKGEKEADQPVTPDPRDKEESKDVQITHENTPVVSTDSDMRITIKLDITVGSHNLIDQFEWDMNSPDNNPEEFAEVMARELALPGEFATAIAHAIREQTQVFTKTLFLTGHGFDGKPIEDDDIRKEICPMVSSNTPGACFRPRISLRDYTPQLAEISALELDRQDKDRERDSRRKRRQGRQGRRAAATLPDVKETIRTFRTPVYSALVPGGIDKYHEFMQRQANRAEESDEEEDSFRPMRRGRPSGRSSRLTSNSPAPHTTPMFTPQFLAQNLDNYKQMYTPEGRRKMVVKLKVPRLKQLLQTGHL